jgi:hypothetical protein
MTTYPDKGEIMSLIAASQSPIAPFEQRQLTSVGQNLFRRE